MSDQTQLASSSSSVHPKSAFHKPELDLLRFVAFLLVFVHHGLQITRQFQYGSWKTDWFELLREPTGYGLCLFFVLSSYLITEILVRETEATGTIHLTAFYVRRILRIWPLYICFLPFGYIFGRMVPNFFIHKTFVLQYVFLMGNYAFYHNLTGNPIGPLWSISVEEQFYVCWPFVALKFGSRGLVGLSLLAILGSIVSSSWLTAHALHPGFAIWTSSFAEFGCFGAGALLALTLHNKNWRPNLLSRLSLLFCGIASWMISDGLFHFKRAEMLADRAQIRHIFGFQLAIVGCSFVFLSALSLPLGRWAKPLVYFGRISYGLYVFHILAILAAKEIALRTSAEKVINGNVLSSLIMLVAFLASTCCAVISYEYFEKRFLRLKKRFTFVRT